MLADEIEAIKATFAHVSPGLTPEDREIARQLRAAGLWEPLCRTALWQGPAFDGRPVHSETSALATILSHTGEPEAGDCELGDRMLDVVGREALADALLRLGRGSLCHESWLYWKRALGLPIVPADDEVERFADGWGARYGTAPYPDGDLPDGCIPDTDPDENIAWGADPETGKLYPILI